MEVLNKRHTDDGVYIGRPSKWGNPFVIGLDGDRATVIAKYEEYARKKFTADDLAVLAGQNLVCWCAPLPCHGDVLVKLVQESEDTR